MCVAWEELPSLSLWARLLLIVAFSQLTCVTQSGKKLENGAAEVRQPRCASLSVRQLACRRASMTAGCMGCSTMPKNGHESKHCCRLLACWQPTAEPSLLHGRAHAPHWRAPFGPFSAVPSSCDCRSQQSGCWLACIATWASTTLLLS